jgi:hypothetical protein
MIQKVFSSTSLSPPRLSPLSYLAYYYSRIKTVTPGWVIDTVGFEPMSHFISKSSSFAINILCSVVTKGFLNFGSVVY